MFYVGSGGQLVLVKWRLWSVKSVSAPAEGELGFPKNTCAAFTVLAFYFYLHSSPPSESFHSLYFILTWSPFCLTKFLLITHTFFLSSGSDSILLVRPKIAQCCYNNTEPLNQMASSYDCVEAQRSKHAQTKTTVRQRRNRRHGENNTSSLSRTTSSCSSFVCISSLFFRLLRSLNALGRVGFLFEMRLSLISGNFWCVIRRSCALSSVL